jgi:hypothetical protein
MKKEILFDIFRVFSGAKIIDISEQTLTDNTIQYTIEYKIKNMPKFLDFLQVLDTNKQMNEWRREEVKKSGVQKMKDTWKMLDFTDDDVENFEIFLIRRNKEISKHILSDT